MTDRHFADVLTEIDARAGKVLDAIDALGIRSRAPDDSAQGTADSSRYAGSLRSTDLCRLTITKRFGVQMPDEAEMTTTERACTSPIWYTP